MLDPVIEFFSRTFYLIGRGIGQLVAWILWPFARLYAFYRSTGFIWKSLIGLVVASVVLAYGWFAYNAMVLRGYNPEFVEAYDLSDRKISAGEAVSTSSTGSTRTCAW